MAQEPQQLHQQRPANKHHPYAGCTATGHWYPAARRLSAHEALHSPVWSTARHQCSWNAVTTAAFALGRGPGLAGIAIPAAAGGGAAAIQLNDTAGAQAVSAAADCCGGDLGRRRFCGGGDADAASRARGFRRVHAQLGRGRGSRQPELLCGAGFPGACRITECSTHCPSLHHCPPQVCI